jgi:hypothetical protein
MIFNCLISHQTIIIESDPSTGLPGNASLLQTLEANKVSIDAKPDYKNTFYFNTTIPPFGTNTAGYKYELSKEHSIDIVANNLPLLKFGDAGISINRIKFAEKIIIEQ